MKTALLDYKYQHLGTVYRLVEQFELISRTDLAKLAGFAPASITTLTKLLIEHQFILERSSQNLQSRGRPAVGLAVSPFYWQYICLTLSLEGCIISLCELNGKIIYQQNYTIRISELSNLDQQILTNIQHFSQHYPLNTTNLLAISISVLGKIDSTKSTIIQLGNIPVNSNVVTLLQTQFHQPILLNDHFQLWCLSESTLGSLISQENVIFLQLNDTVNLSVLLQGKVLHQGEHKRMNVDKMIMPKFSHLSDEIYPTLNNVERYQLCNQITFPALAKLIDLYLPNHYEQNIDKINWLCQQIALEDPSALNILEHIADNLAYMLMNLINIFSTEKIMFDSPLLQIKAPLFEKIKQKLTNNLLLPDLNIDLVTSQYDWHSTMIPAIAIKLGIYEGSLIKNIISL